MTLYEDGFRMLWQYPEFQLLFTLFRTGLLLVVGAVVFIAGLHIFYLLGRDSWLYRHRSPRPHWSRRFFLAAAVLTLFVYGLYLFSGTWVTAGS